MSDDLWWFESCTMDNNVKDMTNLCGMEVRAFAQQADAAVARSCDIDNYASSSRLSHFKRRECVQQYKSSD